MNPPSQQVFLGNQQHPPAAPGLFVSPTIPDGKLWGSNVRRSMGTTQIICGGIEFALGIAVICVPTYYFDRVDYAGWGVWTGVMNPPSQQVFLGNQQHPPAAPGLFVSPTIPDGKLWGSNVRRSMGTTQIICGGIEFALGIAVICVPTYYFDRVDYAGWGVWTGVFAIVAGFLGVFSLKKKGMVIAYTVTSIISAVLCGCCVVYAIFGTLLAYPRRDNLALYIIMCIVFFIHMVISIIGASFICGALSFPTNQSQEVVYYTPRPLQQQYGPTPPYTVVASQSGITSQTTSSGTNGVFVSPKM